MLDVDWSPVASAGAGAHAAAGAPVPPVVSPPPSPVRFRRRGGSGRRSRGSGGRDLGALVGGARRLERVGAVVVSGDASDPGGRAVRRRRGRGRGGRGCGSEAASPTTAVVSGTAVASGAGPARVGWRRVGRGGSAPAGGLVASCNGAVSVGASASWARPASRSSRRGALRPRSAADGVPKPLAPWTPCFTSGFEIWFGGRRRGPASGSPPCRPPLACRAQPLIELPLVLLVALEEPLLVCDTVVLLLLLALALPVVIDELLVPVFDDDEVFDALPPTFPDVMPLEDPTLPSVTVE